MPLILSDRIKVRSRTVGTAALVLEEAFAGFRNFDVIGDGNETYYGITDIAGNWEIGRGTYTVSTATLTRDSILSSSYNDAIVNFPAGAKTVFCTLPASAANEFVYNLSAESAIDGGIIRLAFSEGSVDDVKLTGSDGITVTRTDENTIDISALAVTQSAETTSGGAILRLDRDGTADDIAVIGNTGVVVTRTDANTITLTSDIAQSAETTSGGAILRLDKTGTTDDVSFIGNTGVVVTRTDANTITLTSDIAQSAESTSGGAILRLDKTGTTDDVVFQGNNGVEVSRVDANTIKIDATEASGLAIVMGL